MERDQYTQQAWEKMPDAIMQSQTLDQTRELWWHDNRPDGGWRLSWAGLVDLTDLLKVQCWHFDFASREIQPWMLLKLKKHICTPYYIVDNRKHIQLVVLDSQLAVMINLYGEVEKWIRSLG